MKPFFSVILPVYNSNESYQMSLNSVECQTFSSFEIIVVDDSSLLPVRVNNPNQLIKLKKNQGPAAARNAGIVAAAGEYVCFIDAGDIWDKHKLNLIHKCIIDSGSKFLGHEIFHKPTLFPKIKKDEMSVKKITAIQLLLKNPTHTSTLVIRRDEMKAFDETFRYCEDYDFILRNSEDLSFSFISTPLAFRDRPVLSPGGLSENRIRMRMGELKTYFKFCRRHRLLPLFPVFVAFSFAKHVRKLLSEKYR